VFFTSSDTLEILFFFFPIRCMSVPDWNGILLWSGCIVLVLFVVVGIRCK
jgi:hypothetical protein